MKTLPFDHNPILNALWFGFALGIPAGMGLIMAFLGAMTAMEVLGFQTNSADWFIAGLYFVSGLIIMVGSVALVSRVRRKLLKSEEAVLDRVVD